MRPSTLRRKLQKKLKHKPYRKCPRCGKRCRLVLRDDGCHSFCLPRLFKVCGRYRTTCSDPEFGCNGVAMRIEQPRYVGQVSWSLGGDGCGYKQELFWSGGGTGRHIPPVEQSIQDASA